METTKKFWNGCLLKNASKTGAKNLGDEEGARKRNLNFGENECFFLLQEKLETAIGYFGMIHLYTKEKFRKLLQKNFNHRAKLV